MDELESGLDYLANRSAPVPKYASRSILVKEVNWLGDLVMSLPALRAIRKAYPLTRLSVLVKGGLAGFFDGMNWIDEVISYPDQPQGLKYKLNIVRNLRSRKFDLAILFPNSFESALWTMLAGIPRRAGYATDARGFMLTDRANPSDNALTAHQSRYWLEMVRDTLGIYIIEEASYSGLEIGNQHRDRMHSWLHERRARHGSPLIALAPIAAYGPAKEWPTDRYTSLIDQLAQRFNAECVIVGASSERPRCETLAAATHSNPLIAAGDISLGELIALLSFCDGFVGNDSGAMHLAGSLGIPTVGLFGSTNPIRTGALGPKVHSLIHRVSCNPCLARTCRFEHYECLNAIAPDEVIHTLAELGAFYGRN
jgi:lipopolysaccharide heptosyltransferase II